MSRCLTMPHKIQILMRLASPVSQYSKKSNLSLHPLWSTNDCLEIPKDAFAGIALNEWRSTQAALSLNRLRRLPDVLSDTPESSIVNSVASISNRQESPLETNSSKVPASSKR